MQPKSALRALLPQARGLAGRIYLAFLMAAVVPTSIAGAIGIFYSLETLKHETLAHLRHEVAGRSDALGRFFDQLSSELLYLARSPSLADLVAAAGADIEPMGHRNRIERDFAAFAKAYPHIYQIRYLDARGREVVRIDRRGGEIGVVAEPDLQDKSGRYYVHEILALRAGEIYVSPLDLNVEGEEPEKPEIPVIRFGTPVTDPSGASRGLLIINLHAEIMLGQIQQMADMRGGIAYLFNRSGFYLARSADDPAHPQFAMNSVEALAEVYPRPVLGRILAGDGGTEVAGDWILAFAPVTIATAGEAKEWVIALAFPRMRLLEAVFNLTILYAVLAVSLAVTALAGFLLSTHLLRPLMLLKEEVAEIARSNFSQRLAIRGHDEIAELGRQFNMMAGELQQYYASLVHRQQVLEQGNRVNLGVTRR